MKSFAAIAALAAAVPFVLGQGLQVNSLSGVVECEPILVSWSGGSPPYYLSMIPGGQPSAPALKQFDPMQGTSFTWNVDIPAGTSFSTQLKDASGQAVFSGIQTVEAGSNSSCVNNSVMEGASASASASVGTQGAAAAATTTTAPSTAGSTASGTTTTGTTTTTTATGSGIVTTTHTTQSASGTSATATSTQNAAARGTSASAFGIAGLLGLVGAALF